MSLPPRDPALARIWARPIPTAVPGFEPASTRRAAPARWTVRVRRRGRVLTVTLRAPSVLVASLSMQELEAAVWAYTRRQAGAP